MRLPSSKWPRRFALFALICNVRLWPTAASFRADDAEILAGRNAWKVRARCSSSAGPRLFPAGRP